MSLSELLPTLQLLTRSDKLRAIQFLAAELEREDESHLIEPGRSYPIWSPFDAHAAATILLLSLRGAATA
jgi:hypothetical protein